MSTADSVYQDPETCGVAGLYEAAEAFVRLLQRHPGLAQLKAPDYSKIALEAGTLRRELAWDNWIYSGANIRRAHVEYFSVPGQIGVLHVCIFPEMDSASPIFGFDVVSGTAKATGVFLDLSPTVPQAGWMIREWGASAAAAAEDFGIPRDLPEWAGIFSPHVVAVRPRSLSDVQKAVAFALRSLEFFLTAPEPCDPAHMRAAQQNYVDGQKRNPHTRRMLAGCVGDKLASEFIDEVLFPQPPASSGFL